MERKIGEHTIETSAALGTEEAFEIHHAKNTRDTSDGPKTHDEADADLRLPAEIAFHKYRDWNEHECPVCNYVDGSVNVTCR